MNNLDSNNFDESITESINGLELKKDVHYNYLPTVVNLDENTQKTIVLSQEVVIQNQIIMQVSKIITLCKTKYRKKVSCNKQYVEAEKILLLQTYKKKNLLNEIHSNNFDNDNEDYCNYFGSVRISNLQFIIKNKMKNSKKANKKEQWYVCILTCGTEVLSSEVKKFSCDSSSILCFNEDFEFSKLKSNFEIKLHLYYMEVEKSPKENFKNYLTQDINTNDKTLKLNGLFKWNQNLRDFDLSSICQLSTSSFLLSGSLTINSKNLKEKNNSSCTHTLENLNFLNTFDVNVFVNISSAVEITEKYFGLVTIGSEIGGSLFWDKLWCFLEGSVIVQKTYPSDDDMIFPFQKIDLAYCVNSQICEASREFCSRSKSLLIEIASNKKSTNNIVKYFLSFDTNIELQTWKIKLNAILSHLRNWNSMKHDF